MVFTLSPVPLKATFTEKSCVVANSASKAIIRAALSSVENKKVKNFNYWPSYEIVTEIGMHTAWTSFGSPREVYHRHVNQELVNIATQEFVRNYFRK